MESHRVTTLEEVLSTKQIRYILNQAAGVGWQLVGSEIKPASSGLAGFQGDHFRVTFDVRVEDSVRQIKLFVKCLPLSNKPKAQFIDEHNFYRREMIMLQLLGTIQTNTSESHPWCTKAYICSENIVVMPDLLYQGYRQRPLLDYLDLKHALLTAASIARFHAAFANNETKRSLSGYPPFSSEHADTLKEPTFNDSPWLHAAAKLTKNFLTAFSEKCNQYSLDLEETLVQLYIEACNSLTESSSLNVIIHKDLWVNNIMFRYDGETPVNALLIDYQCVRYGPPAFDLMIFLYLNTSTSFRKKYETMIFKHYYVIFLESLDDETKRRVQTSGYDFDVFVGWCHKARMFSLLEAIGIFPYVLMEPGIAQKIFDDPETFMKYCNEDRTEPVIAHAKQYPAYRHRQLEVCEEFLERYVMKKVGL